MCQYQPWEDESIPDGGNHLGHVGHMFRHVDVRWEAEIAMLAARIADVEARVERLEARMLRLQKGLRIICVLLLFTLVYAFCK